MAKINFEKAVEKTIHSGKIPGQYFMDCDSIQELVRIAREDDVFDAINKAFCAGMVAGNHATLKQGLKRL